MLGVMAYSMPAQGERNVMNATHAILVSVDACNEDATFQWFFQKYGFCSSADVAYEPKQWITGTLRQLTRPYIMITSQWQQWNMFAPDPLRRVSGLEFEVQRAGEWQPYLLLNADTIQWWRRAHFLKIARRMTEEDRNEPLSARLTQLTCTNFQLPPGTPVRVKENYYVIPYDKIIMSTEWWNTWAPEQFDRVLATTNCPSV